MRKLTTKLTTFFLTLFTALAVFAEGPVYTHRDPIVNQEFINAYQDIRSKVPLYSTSTFVSTISASGYATLSGTQTFTGLMGIGITPTFKLHIKGGNDNQLVLDNAGETYTSMYFRNNGDDKVGLYWNGTQFVVNTAAVTQPLQPSFLAKNSARQTDVTGDGTAHTVTWGVEVFDQGADFASNQFVAPVAGKYQLQCSLMSTNNTTSHNIRYLKIETSNASFFLEDQTLTAGERSQTISVLADMDANDVAYIVFYVGGSTKVVDIYESDYTYFSGSLIN